MPIASGRLGAHTVSRVGYGAMQLEHAPHDTALTVLRRAVELGVTHLDTAEFYGEDGLVNGLIREALHPYPDDMVLVSKVGAERGPKGLVPAQRPPELRAQVEANLRRLDVERLDVVNLRRVDGGAGIRAEGDQIVPLAEQLTELSALRDEGKVGAIGLSNVDLDQLREALPAGIVCVQNYYNLLERGDEPLLAECAAHGIAWVPFFPLGSGFGHVPKVTDLPAVRDAAAAAGATPAQIGLAWLLGHDPNVLLIPGTSSIEHLEQNLAAADMRLDAATTATLDAAAATME